MQAYSFRISVSGLARRLGVSRIHIPTLLQDADRAGYLRWNARTRELAFTPPLVAALESYYGRLFLFIGFFATQFVAMGGVRTGWAIAFEAGQPIVSRNAAMNCPWTGPRASYVLAMVRIPVELTATISCAE